MECSLDRREYMGLDYDHALAACRGIVDQVYRHNGELVLLWHNTSFCGAGYHEQLYRALLEYAGALGGGLTPAREAGTLRA